MVEEAEAVTFATSSSVGHCPMDSRAHLHCQESISLPNNFSNDNTEPPLSRRMLLQRSSTFPCQEADPEPHYEKNCQRISRNTGSLQVRLAMSRSFRSLGMNGSHHLDSHPLDEINSEMLSAEPAPDRPEDLAELAKLEKWYVPREKVKLGVELGRGAGGVVYLAQWCGMRCVAKTLHSASTFHSSRDTKETLSEPIARRDLMNEVAVLSTLRHPNLVLFLGACVDCDALLILSEYIENGNFELHVRRERELRLWAPSKLQVYTWAIHLAQALAFLHNCRPPVIHRDLKPCNLLIDRASNIRVCDFGLSKFQSKVDLDERYLMTGKTGSLRYMAPEVFLDDPHYSSSIDIYSASLIFWFMATGLHPFSVIPPRSVAVAAAMAHARPSTHLIDSKHFLLASIMKRCWDHDPAKRPSALELVADLRLCHVATHTLEQEHVLSKRAGASALLHQCIAGPCQTPAPFVLKIRKRARWAAWRALRNMSKEDAHKELSSLLEKNVSRSQGGQGWALFDSILQESGGRAEESMRSTRSLQPQRSKLDDGWPHLSRAHSE